MTEQAVIKSWGNSQGLRISKSVLQEAGLSVNEQVLLEVTDGQILIKKTFRHKTFEERLAEFDGKISTYHMDWGEDIGREVIE